MSLSGETCLVIDVAQHAHSMQVAAAHGGSSACHMACALQGVTVRDKPGSQFVAATNCLHAWCVVCVHDRCGAPRAGCSCPFISGMCCCALHDAHTLLQKPYSVAVAVPLRAFTCVSMLQVSCGVQLCCWNGQCVLLV